MIARLALTEVESALLSAVVAAGISLVVGILTFWSTRMSRESEESRHAKELERAMTMKLYEQRMAAYPKVWPMTESLRRSVMLRNGAQHLPQYMANALVELDEWGAGDAAMMLSADALEAFYELRESLRAEPERPDGYSDAQMHRIWRAKGDLRSELRRDVALLFEEEKSIKPPSSSKYKARLPDTGRWSEEGFGD